MTEENDKPPTIDSLHPRIGASFALIPITIGIETLLYLVVSYFGNSFDWGWPVWGILLGAVPVVIFYGGSLLIWYPVVRWTPLKVRRTIYLSVGLALVILAAGIGGSMIDLQLGVAAVFVVGLIGGGIGIFLLNIIWWTPPHLRDRSGAVPCPKCGYDLRAQRECCCPECGEQFTLSQLATPPIGGAEL